LVDRGVRMHLFTQKANGSKEKITPELQARRPATHCEVACGLERFEPRRRPEIGQKRSSIVLNDGMPRGKAPAVGMLTAGASPSALPAARRAPYDIHHPRKNFSGSKRLTWAASSKAPSRLSMKRSTAARSSSAKDSKSRPSVYLS
jgi:hypothetical protein